LTLKDASEQYWFTQEELTDFIAAGELRSKTGTTDPLTGKVCVLRQQCCQLREQRGFPETQAAARLGVSIEDLQLLLEDLDWRKTQAITLTVLQSAVKRLQSCEGYTIEEAANALSAPAKWVEARVLDGTVRLTNTKWNPERQYLPEPMFQRLKEAFANPTSDERLGADWLHLSDAANESGVSAGTITNWVNRGELERRPSLTGWRYHREAVRARARLYWPTVRFHRATPPAWLQAEIRAKSKDQPRVAGNPIKRSLHHQPAGQEETCATS
jgi:DNA-directed RNA polymerase specialized sigma24 family protein